ncbi:hypothetical protein ACFV4X_34995 [Streptomyces ardesiacus]|uniref:hypothetical protein n=1 Tax=Streptomyces ardesiacus TaxID=285564 RepID=UPI00365C8CC1
MSSSSNRARQRILKRKIDAIPAILRSSRPGIHYTATICATLSAKPQMPFDPEEIADRIRSTLRTAVAAAVREQDPIDLPAARDACARHLRTPHRISHRQQSIEVTASVHLDLADSDRRAVEDLLAAMRTQATTDALAAQRAVAFADQLAHPAALLTRWLQQPDADVARPPGERELESLARRLREYPKDRDEPLELQLLYLLREFLAEFPKEEQKLLLIRLLAGGMRAARKPRHADRVEALAAPLADGHAENTTGVTS